MTVVGEGNTVVEPEGHGLSASQPHCTLPFGHILHRAGQIVLVGSPLVIGEPLVIEVVDVVDDVDGGGGHVAVSFAQPHSAVSPPGQIMHTSGHAESGDALTNASANTTESTERRIGTGKQKRPTRANTTSRFYVSPQRSGEIECDFRDHLTGLASNVTFQAIVRHDRIALLVQRV